MNALPAWRRACVARLNSLFMKLRPPTIARIAPVRGSIATRAASGSVGLGGARDRALGRVLHVAIERRPDPEAAAVEDIEAAMSPGRVGRAP